MKGASVFAGLLVIGVVGAAHAEPSFSKDVKPLVTKYCVECHGATKPKAGVDLSTYKDLTKEGKKGAAVVAGMPEKSLLTLSMEGKGAKKMPPKKYEKQPTAAEIATIKDWIKAGAKDDSGKTELPPEQLETAVAFAAETAWFERRKFHSEE